MSTVFQSSFLDNLRRIHAESNGRKRPENSLAEGGIEFSKILADIEKQRGKESDPKVLTQPMPVAARVPEKSDPIPTTAAVQFLLSPESPLFSFASNHVNTLECAFNECSPPVSKLSIDVKNPAPLAVNGLGISEELEDELPSPPIVRSIERISMSVPKDGTRPVRFSKEELDNIITTAGKFHGVDPALGMAVAKVESSYRTDAISKDGHASKGMFQLLDSTAGDLMNRFDMKDRYDPFDPAMNAYLGVGYLRRLHDIFSSETNLGYNVKTVPVKSAPDLEKIALAAYNAGEGNVATAQKLARRVGKDPAQYQAIEAYLPPSTRAYVQRVTEFKTQIARAAGGDDIA